MPTADLTTLPTEEDLAFLRRKGYHVGFDWRDVWQEEHAHAFTVATAMQVDLLAEIRTALDTALAEGQSLAQFQDGLEPLLRRWGWWGHRVVTNPQTGEARVALLGLSSRLRLIFNANVRTAYTAWQWARIERVQAAWPYLRYITAGDARVRPDHAAWHGLILPVDDPWWTTHYPPNGWRCRCRVVPLSAADLAQRGWTISQEHPAS